MVYIYSVHLNLYCLGYSTNTRVDGVLQCIIAIFAPYKHVEDVHYHVLTQNSFVRDSIVLARFHPKLHGNGESTCLPMLHIYSDISYYLLLLCTFREAFEQAPTYIQLLPWLLLSARHFDLWDECIAVPLSVCVCDALSMLMQYYNTIYSNRHIISVVTIRVSDEIENWRGCRREVMKMCETYSIWHV